MSAHRGSPRAAPTVSGLLVLFSTLLLLRATPILRMYWDRIRAALASKPVALSTLAFSLGFVFLFLGIRRMPRQTAAGVALLSLGLIVRSGNGPALLIALGVLGITLLAGDALARSLRGRETEGGEVPILLAAGCVALGTLLFLFGEVRLVRAPVLALTAASLILLRRRRLRPLARHLRDSVGAAVSRPCTRIEALFLTIVAAALFSGFLGALGPDLSWDALQTHLPQIRDFAEKGRVLPIPNLYPVTFVWRAYETYLGLAFLAGGERVVRLVHLAVALAAFGAVAVLARRLGGNERSPLALLALAAFPTACSQLKETYVDLPAALLITCAAAEIAASRNEPRRAWLAGFLFGGAVATKFFALLGAPGLAVLWLRRQMPSARRLLPVAAIALLPVAPWMAWSHSRLGYFLAPYHDPHSAERTDPLSPTYGPPINPGGLPFDRRLSVVSFLRLPYDLTFHRPLFHRTDGYTGLLAPLLLFGASGWGRRRFGLFCTAALAAVLPWYAATSLGRIAFSNRYLIPVYPMYAVFGSLGLSRLTENFRGRTGTAAALSIAALAIAYPVRLLTGPHDLRAAMGLESRQSVLASLPSYPLWANVRPDDRVLLLGDPDRYHCPARFVVNDVIIHQTRIVDPNRWQTEWRPLRINVLVHRIDRRDARPLLHSLGGCLHSVAGNGVARLYRVDSGSTGCAPPTAATHTSVTAQGSVRASDD